MIDDPVPNDLLDNILYYISGFIAMSLLPKLQCSKCKEALFLDPTHPTAFTMDGFPVYAKFIQSLQRAGLTFPSSAIMQIVKAIEVIFKRRVITCTSGITHEKNIDLKQNQLL